MEEANEPEFTNAITEQKTVDINELRAYTSLQDWLQDNDPEGTFAIQRDAAVDTLGPLLDDRTRLMKEVVRTLAELNNTATNSSGAADPVYDALNTAHQHAKNEMSTNDALIRGTLESHRAELENTVKMRHAAMNSTTPAPAEEPVPFAPQGVPPTPSGGGGPTPTPVTPPLRDNIFSGVKIASAYTYISEHKALQWPSAEDRANLMERTSVSALRAGMAPVWGPRSICHPRRAGRVLRGDSRTSGQLYAPIARV